MKLFLLVSVLALAAANPKDVDSPIDKVVVLIKGLVTSIEGDGKKEQQSYDTYACWVEATLQRKAGDISNAKELLGELADSVLKAKAEIASHQAEINQLNKDIAQNKEAQKEANGIRDKENAAYAGERSESEQCIGALEAAIKALTGAGTKTGFLQQAKLMSVAGGLRMVLQHVQKMSSVSDADLSAVRRFVESPESFAKGAMSAAQTGQNPFGDYAPQSTQIQGILKGMYDAFTGDLEKDNANEASAQKAFEALMATKKQELATLEATLQKQETEEAAKTKQLAEDQVLRDDTTDQVNADEKFFEETKDAAEAKGKEWSTRTRLRTEELAGMQGAIEILSGGNKVFDEATTTFLQLKATTSHEAYGKMRSLAAKYQSASLAQVMVAMKSGGHFDKVMIMIDNMMALLREEEQDDISHRDRCENGQNANSNEMEDHNSAIDKTKKALGRMDNTAGDLEKAIKGEEDKIIQSNKDLDAMLDQRNTDHAAFQRALQMDSEAITLIESATVRLSKYYKENKIPLSFEQSPEYSQDQDKAPETSFSGSNKRQGESGGIVAILNMIKEDLQKEMKEGRADEAEAQGDYDKQSGSLQDSLDAQKETKASLEEQLSGLEDKMAASEQYKRDKEADLGSEESMKGALETDCKWVTTHFKKRRDARKTEMDGLVEAKNFLAGVEAGDAVLAPSQ